MLASIEETAGSHHIQWLPNYTQLFTLYMQIMRFATVFCKGAAKRRYTRLRQQQKQRADKAALCSLQYNCNDDQSNTNLDQVVDDTEGKILQDTPGDLPVFLVTDAGPVDSFREDEARSCRPHEQ